MNSTANVFFGTRIPAVLKRKMSRYCHVRGIRMNYLITRAIQEKLSRLAEDEEDIALVKTRLKDAEFISQDKMDACFSKRNKR